MSHVQTIGTCSLCGGNVVLPTVWGGVTPPTPSCYVCGATKKAPFGEVIEMEKPQQKLDDLDNIKFIRNYLSERGNE